MSQWENSSHCEATMADTSTSSGAAKRPMRSEPSGSSVSPRRTVTTPATTANPAKPTAT